MTRSIRPGVACAMLAGALAVVTAAPDAQAQIIHRLYLHGELGLGTMVSDFQRSSLGYDGLGGELTLRAGLRFAGPLQVQLGFANWLWLRDQGSNGRLLSLELGLRARFDDNGARGGGFWFDVNLGPGFTGDLTRLHLNAGLGYDFSISRSIGLGPFARFGMTIQDSSDPFPDSAQFFAAGVNLTYHVPPSEAPPPPAPGDRDGDGVIDPEDVCVDVPMGNHPDPERRGCPLGDLDGDGVLDPQDLCPRFPMGDEPNPERLGCPDDDNDGDGVVDHRDQCPLEPMDPTPDPDRLGCRRIQTVINLGEILFEVDSATILDNDQNNHSLNQAQATFTAHPDIELFSIEGHTDERDSDRHNQRLSVARAEAVRDWLAAHGIDTSRMVPAGYGEYCPVNQGHDEAAWAQNRRVVFVIARRGGAVEAGARFGCAAGAEHIPAVLSALVPAPAPEGRHGRHGRGHRGHRSRHGRH